MSAPLPDPPLVTRIISGGQTGVDRGALDAAISLNIPHGGWCPRGRLAEDGVIPERYQLKETRSTLYRFRTEQNVLDSDGTLIIHRGPLQGGSELTYRLALRYRKPCLLVDLLHPVDPQPIRQWLVDSRIQTLNVAGPRESSAPGICTATYHLLREVLEDASSREG